MRRSRTTIGSRVAFIGLVVLAIAGCAASGSGRDVPVTPEEAWDACGATLADLDQSLTVGAAGYAERVGDPFSRAGITGSGIQCTAVTERGGFLWVLLPDDGEPVVVNRSGAVVPFD